MEDLKIKYEEDRELRKLESLRQYIISNIQLADNKAIAISSVVDMPEMKELLLKVLQPDLETEQPPEGYELFNSTSIEHIQYECDYCRKILLKKYQLINDMIALGNEVREIEERRKMDFTNYVRSQREKKNQEKPTFGVENL